jgi:hypothetical protein
MLPDLRLQPLRIPAGWLVSYNNGLYEIDPDPAVVPEPDRWWVFKQDILQMRHEATNAAPFATSSLPTIRPISPPRLP